MNDPETIFSAFAAGEIDSDALLSQLVELLQQSPGLAKQILAQLEQLYEQKQISDTQHVAIKRKINEFRRAHATKTEASEDLDQGDATVFAEEEQIIPLDMEVDSEDDSIELEKTDRLGEKDSQTTTDLSTSTQVTSEDDSDTIKIAGLSPDTDSGAFFISTDSSLEPADVAATNIITPERQEAAEDFHVGSVIKQRFKLEKVLGVGGMGKVYKALDLLKYEAKDKKPYVAVKLLNEDFKNHPEAFISLQRESSRQQKLAHPNIVTIYDFDRVGGPGTPVFITMEFMEGTEVKHFIKKKVLPQGGLPFEQAYEIIRQISAGLIYAHERRLVHSDFKPGNAFICNDGSVKILDFGIARAVKNPVTGEAEKTLFDPGKLGALTPAYASLEMLAGKEPDTRDDIYALGCTAYELLTGKHPFNKLSADKAKNNGLTPPYIKKLNKKQNRALARAVAFERANRSPTVAHFLEELKGRATWHKNPFTIAAAVLLLVAIIASGPTLNYLHQKRLGAMAQEINTGDQQLIAIELDRLRKLKAVDQSLVTEQTKEALQAYFSERITMLINAATGSYDFPAAERAIEEISEFYPGSIFLQEQMALVTKVKRQLISSLNMQYSATLEDKTQIDNTKDILDKVRKIDPQHPLLTDARAAIAYRNFARQAFAEGTFSDALELIYSGLEIAPDDQRLLDLEMRIINAQTVQQLEFNLTEIKGQLVTIADFKRYEAAIEQLFRLKPDNALITLFSQQIRPLFKKAMQVILESKSREDAALFVADYQRLFHALKLSPELIQMQLAHLSGTMRAQAAQALAEQNIDQIEQHLASPNIRDLTWEATLLANINTLADLASEDPTIKGQFDYFRPKIEALYIDAANKALDEKRFDVADNIIERCYERFAIRSKQILAIRSAIAIARDSDALQEQIRINKVNLETFASSDSLAEALKVYEELKADLPENDIYLTTEAIPMLSGVYARLAKSSASNEDFRSAYSLVQRGLEIDPNNLELQGIKDEYEAEANIIELTWLFDDETVLSFPSDVRIKIDQIENFAATRRAIVFRETAIKRLRERINALKASNRNAAARVARSAAEIFPFSSVLAKFRDELQLAPWDQYTAASTLLSAGKLSKAQQIRQQAAAKYNGHPQFDSFSKTLDQKIAEANNIFSIFVKDKDAAGQDYEQLKKARNLLARAQQLWTDSADFAAAEKELEALITRYKPRPKPKIRAVERDISELAETVGALQRATWKPITSNAECTSRLAGYGLRSKAVCYDMIHDKARGPLMVVVPADDTSASFAFSKYEISVADWSKYCILSGTCQAIKGQDKNKPITGISLEQSKSYAAWLSERTGKTYRLPTKQEWEYAAKSGGKQPKKDFNCHIALGDKTIKGSGVVSVKSGKSNAWGIKNYIGNVQEWVTDGRAIKVRGGAFTDAHFKCAISLERAHDGSADEITGLRLVREEISE